MGIRGSLRCSLVDHVPRVLQANARPRLKGAIRAVPTNTHRSALNLHRIPVLRLEVVRHLTAVLRQFLHDLLVQPDVHRRRIIHVAGVVQLGSQLLPRI
jgi:hypothetical protein